MRTWVLVAAVIFTGCQAKAPELSPAELQAKFEHEEKALWGLHDDWHDLVDSLGPSTGDKLKAGTEEQLAKIDKNIDDAILKVREAAATVAPAPDWSTEIAKSKLRIAALDKLDATYADASKKFEQIAIDTAKESNSMTSIDSVVGLQNSSIDSAMSSLDSSMKQLENMKAISREKGRLRILERLQESN